MCAEILGKINADLYSLTIALFPVAGTYEEKCMLREVKKNERTKFSYIWGDYHLRNTSSW